MADQGQCSAGADEGSRMPSSLDVEHDGVSCCVGIEIKARIRRKDCVWCACYRPAGSPPTTRSSMNHGLKDPYGREHHQRKEESRLVGGEDLCGLGKEGRHTKHSTAAQTGSYGL